MPNLKNTTLLCCLSLLIINLPAAAHVDKGFDRNGGHYDPFGDYHCHQVGCQQAPSRYSIMPSNRSRLSRRDQDLFYNEDDWPYWGRVGNTCKTVRTQVLEYSSSNTVTYTNPRQCEVREGLWIDPYTGEEFTRAAKLEIDHVIPPQYANASNGYQWDDQKRYAFANDPLNLVPVSRQIQRKKRQRGIGSWRPPEESYQCTYAMTWRNVAKKYDLDLFARDRSRINSILEDCDLSEFETIEEEGTSTDVEIRSGGVRLPL